jgi:prepilin-type N-terminal cleavage/methylation domain-containing protein
MKENLFNRKDEGFIQHHKTGAGFTLIEILISMSVFVLLVFAVSVIYVAFNNSQMRTTASQQLLNDSQYAMELMAREIKNNSIVNYAPDPTWCDDVLNIDNSGDIKFEKCIVLEREDGQIFTFTTYDEDTADPDNGIMLLYVSLNNCVPGESRCDRWLLTPGLFARILSIDLNGISIESLDFEIYPTTDPFVGNLSNQQPKITINMTTTNASQRIIENLKHTFQTTVSSRIYRR